VTVARPLRARLQLAIILAVLVFGSLNVVLVGRITYLALRAEQDRRLLFVTRLVAQRAARPLLVDDQLALQKLLDESRALDPDLAYVAVFDARRGGITKSAGPEAARWLDERKSTASPQPETPYREAVEGIMDGQLGEVHVGVAETTLRATLGRIVTVISLMVLAFLAAGVAGAAFIARTVTKPVEKLVEFASTVRLEGPLPPLEISSRDEIAQLAGHLESDARRLQLLHAEAKTRERDIARVEHLATVGMLAAGVAHEVNNPLAGIRASVERLLRQTKVPADAERYGTVLRDAISRIERTVKETLTFARASEVHVTPTSLPNAVERALGLAAPRLERTRISLSQSSPADLPLVRADAAHLVQIVLNLVLNACDAMLDGGELVLRSSHDGHFVTLDISDTGPGVPADIADRIFNPFFTTKPRGQGTGLGLAVSRAGAREMGGDLVLALSGGRGACFRLTLAIAAKEDDATHPSR
jgi:two-component system NtrC family sensor kinase